MWIQKAWPDSTTYNAAISASAQGKCWEMALQFLEDCKTCLAPHSIDCQPALTMCLQNGEWFRLTFPLWHILPFLGKIILSGQDNVHHSGDFPLTRSNN